MTNRIDVSKFTIASKDVNKFKNRLVNVLPCKKIIFLCDESFDNPTLDDHCRVILEGKPGDEGSDYINASFIDVSGDPYKSYSYCVVTYAPRATIKKRPTLSLKVHFRTLVVISGE